MGLICMVFSVAGCGSGSSQKGAATSFDVQYQEALQLKNPEIRSKRLVQLAKNQSKLGDTSGSRKSLASAGRACAEIQDNLSRAQATNDLASAQAIVGLHQQARESLKSVQSRIDRISDATSRIRTLSKSAYTYGKYLEESREASSLLAQAEKMVAQVQGTFSQVRSYVRLAYTNHLLGHGDTSDRQLETAVQLSRRIEDSRQRTDATAAVAGIYQRMDQTNQAGALFDEAIGLARSIDDNISQAHGMADLAEKLANSNQPDRAAKLLQEAEDIADTIQDRGLREEVFEKIAKLKRRSTT